MSQPAWSLRLPWEEESSQSSRVPVKFTFWRLGPQKSSCQDLARWDPWLQRGWWANLPGTPCPEKDGAMGAGFMAGFFGNFEGIPCVEQQHMWEWLQIIHWYPIGTPLVPHLCHGQYIIHSAQIDTPLRCKKRERFHFSKLSISL